MKKHPLLQSFAILSLLTFITSGQVFAQKNKTEKALLWEVSGNGLKESSYLFGTYHLLNDSFLEELPEIKKPFAKAKGIVVEIIADSTVSQQIFMNALMPGKRISEMVSPQDFELISEKFKELFGFGLLAFDGIKPAFVNVLMSVELTKKANDEVFKKYTGTPMDTYFRNTAVRSQKKIIALESPIEQSQILMDHFPLEEQARQLAVAIKYDTTIFENNREALALYMNKDIYGLHQKTESMLEPFTDDVSKHLDYLVKDRNINWMKTLPTLIKTGSQFIAVGAGHLPGEFGLIELLRKEGYTVKPVTK